MCSSLLFRYNTSVILLSLNKELHCISSADQTRSGQFHSFLNVIPVYKFLNTADSIKCHFLLNVLLRQTKCTPVKLGYFIVELLWADSGEQTGRPGLTGNPSCDLYYSLPAPLRRTAATTAV